MRKETGTTLIACYDQYGHKVKTVEKPNFVEAKAYAKYWEEEHVSNSAVVSRILYNTISNQDDKWGYDG